MDPISIYGFEIIRPLFLLLFILVFACFFIPQKKLGFGKSWSGRRESNPASRIRIFLPKTCFFVSACFAIFALADFTKTTSEVRSEYATNRLYIALDNSSSMYDFKGGPLPIYCTDADLKFRYPRIFGACRAALRIVDATEKYASSKEGRLDQVGILRFGLHSFVEVYSTTDYDHARRRIRELNWRDPRLGVFTEIHLALWDMFQVALQRNFRHSPGLTPLNEKDRRIILRSIYPEGISSPYHPPKDIKEKLERLREELRDTAFIIITDAYPGQLSSRLDKAPVSLAKMMKLAEFLELPIYVISIFQDHEMVRKFTEKTGYGAVGGLDRGAFYLLKGEGNFEDLDKIVDNILSRRFRLAEYKHSFRRESYTSSFAGLSALFLAFGVFVLYSPFGRRINHGGLA